MTALPWIVIGIVLVEFALADELPAPAVRRTVLGGGTALLIFVAGGLWISPATVGPGHLLAAAGPLAFLLLHAGLRRFFAAVKGGEPVLAYHASVRTSGSSRLFFEPDAERRLSGWDYAYSFLVGVAMLVSVAPALSEIVAAGSLSAG